MFVTKIHRPHHFPVSFFSYHVHFSSLGKETSSSVILIHVFSSPSTVHLGHLEPRDQEKESNAVNVNTATNKYDRVFYR